MIVSASRRTDIPAFHSQWFFERLAEGRVEVANPYNPRQVRRVSLAAEDVDCIIFWSKNPAPLLDNAAALGAYRCGFQFTLNAYGADVEPHVPEISARIDTFRRISDIFGPGNMTWRYDPIILAPGMDADFHISSFESIAMQLRGYTKRCVISFVDHYRSINRFWQQSGIREPSGGELARICGAIADIARLCGMSVSSCAEKLPLEKYGVSPGACLDADWISAITGRPCAEKPAKAQRSLCRCVESADIGSYGSCGHGCRYCYAQRNP
jgi:hypothetical protein